MKKPSRFEWTFLLAVFKIKRLVGQFFGTRTLDYMKKPLCITTRNLREYTTRARSVAKEPETAAWPDSLPADGVLYDIGANVGAYSLIAASRGIRVYAFEPMSQNVEALQENIALNGLSERVAVLPFILGSAAGLSSFSIPDTTHGSSTGFFEEKRGNGVKRVMPILTLDECVERFKLPPPTAMKIDVDGGERDVLVGAMKVLVLPALQSILIEVNDATRSPVEQVLTSAGCSLVAAHPREIKETNLIFRRS